MQTVKTFLLLQKLEENFQSFLFYSWCKQRIIRTSFFLFYLFFCLWWWWIVFVVWLTGIRRLTLFPAGNIVRNPHHPESLSRRKQDLNLPKPDFKLHWIKLYSSDNHYTIALLLMCTLSPMTYRSYYLERLLIWN